MNEEEIRSKILLLFLKDLGFELTDISLESRFTIRLGRSKHKVGRSDILCKRNGKNLFVIELKNDSVAVNQDDIDQEISYARLLPDNIAPFTIVSNGVTIQMFDSMSGEEITNKRISEQSGYWKSGFTLSSEIDLKIRYEALTNFVSFSHENLKAFCEHQVNDNFLQSDYSVFGVVGEAGVHANIDQRELHSIQHTRLRLQMRKLYLLFSTNGPDCLPLQFHRQSPVQVCRAKRLLAADTFPGVAQHPDGLHLLPLL